METSSVQEQIDFLRREIHDLRSNIIRLDARISSETKIPLATFRDIDILKAAHQSDAEHFRHERSEGGSKSS